MIERRLVILIAVVTLLLTACRDGDKKESRPLAVQSVYPAQIRNSSEAFVMVVGSGFREGSSIALNGMALAQPTFVNDALMTALVPAGVATGGYPVTVTRPDGTSARATTPLTVIEARPPGPSPTPAPSPTRTPAATRTPTPTPQPTTEPTPEPTQPPTRTPAPVPTRTAPPPTATAPPAPTPTPIFVPPTVPASAPPMPQPTPVPTIPR